MKIRTHVYAGPPEPVYAAGKKKERASKALGLVKLLRKDSDDGDLIKAELALQEYRRKLDIV
jgi:hypothetical protein